MQIITELDLLRDEIEALGERIRKVEEYYEQKPGYLDDQEQRAFESLTILYTLTDAMLFILP